MEHNYDPDCIFCKIIQGDIPSYKVYEDDIVLAFLDITQGTPGHTLVIPKTHVPDIFAYDTELAEAVFSRIPKIARAVKASDPSIIGMNIVNNNGSVAYQSVFHSHFHLIPRYSDTDAFSMSFSDNSDQYDDAKYSAVRDRIVTKMEDA